MRTWCVAHCGGWCAAYEGKPSDGIVNVPTLCGYFVVLPIGIEYRDPDCDECIKAQAPRAAKEGAE